MIHRLDTKRRISDTFASMWVTYIRNVPNSIINIIIFSDLLDASQNLSIKNLQRTSHTNI